MRKLSLIVSAIALMSIHAVAGDSPAPKDAEVYFVNLESNQRVTSPFTVVFGLKGMGVAPAGVDNEEFPNVGHHHLFIDADLTEEIAENGIPFSPQHMHFGKGQTETELTLPKGKYKLKLVFADPYHVPHDPVVASEPIAIIVE